MKHTIIPSRYNATVSEIVELANNLAMSPTVILPPIRSAHKFNFSAWLNPKPETRNPKPAYRVIIHPHGHTPDEKLQSLMQFFHFLGSHQKSNC